MMEDLARSHGFVAVPFEMHGKRNRVGQMRELPLTVVVNSGVEGRSPNIRAVQLSGNKPGCGMGIGRRSCPSANRSRCGVWTFPIPPSVLVQSFISSTAMKTLGCDAGKLVARKRKSRVNRIIGFRFNRKAAF